MLDICAYLPSEKSPSRGRGNPLAESPHSRGRAGNWHNKAEAGCGWALRPVYQCAITCQPGSLSLLRLGVSFEPMLVIRVRLLMAMGVSLLTSLPHPRI